MSVTSYAQNFEDVILLRALRHIERGFYIDIGAQDPIKYSVTRTFYELGWRGINIEPVSHWFRLLEQDRVHDVNLNVAVSDAPGYLRLYEVLDTGLSTTEEVYARRHTEAGFDVREVDVPCVTLDSICEANGVDEVHFLKVDCEGAEISAFKGFSFDKVRPWIIVVEATEPMSQKPAYAEWEPILLGHGYQFVYEDGLNRFYLASEHRDLAGAFVLPPNVFDAFVPVEVVDATRRLELAQSQLKMVADVERAVRAESERDRVQEQLALSVKYAEQLKVELERVSGDWRQAQVDLATMTKNVGRLEAERQGLDGYIQQLAEANRRLDEGLRRILASRSWRYMSPVRFIVGMTRGNVGVKESARKVITRLAGKSARSRLMRAMVRVMLLPFPIFKNRLRGIARRGLGLEQGVLPTKEDGRARPASEIVLSRSGVEALTALRVEVDRKTAAIN